MKPRREADPMTAVLATFRRRDRPDWGNAWVGMEPTFQTEKSVRKWWKMSAEPGAQLAPDRVGGALMRL